MDSDHEGIRKDINSTPKLTYSSNPSLAKKLVRAKLKRPPKRLVKQNQDGSEKGNNSMSSNDISSHSSNNNSTDHLIRDDHNRAIIAMAEIKHNIDMGLKKSTNKCGDSNCPLHGRLKCTNQARSNISNRAYITRGKADCNTKRIVYLIQCKKCGRQYVGQTGQSLKERFKRHLQKIKDRREVNTMHDHFRKGSCSGTNNIMLQILHVVQNPDMSNEEIESELKKVELLWMDRMMSEYPQGLNHKRNDNTKRSKYYK